MTNETFNLQYRIRISSSIQLRASGWSKNDYINFHQNILSLSDNLSNIFLILDFISKKDNESISVILSEEDSKLSYYLSHSNILGGKLFHDFDNYEEINTFIGKLLGKMSFSKIVNLFYSIINSEESLILSREEWEIYLDNISSYKEMPLSWWLPLVKKN